MNLFKAHRQWASRPDDERFPTLKALYDATREYADQASEKVMPFNTLRTEAIDGDVQLVGTRNLPAKLTHWSFGQLAARVKAPADYIRNLPATLAVQNLNYGLAHANDEDKARNAYLLFHTNGDLLCRAITSDKYARIWNYEVAERLLALQSIGWEPATPDTNFAPTAGRFLDPSEMKSTALYASDHDLFAFLRNENLGIRTRPNGETTGRRGVIVENSEVGESSLRLTRFIYDYMCGNHIIWGASQVIELAIRHIGDAKERMAIWAAELKRYSNESASEEESRITKARSTVIAATKEEVLDKVFGMRNIGLGRKVLDASYDAVKPEEDGDPNTVWGLVQGVTRHSQTIPYADKRTDLDRAAGKLLEVAF